MTSHPKRKARKIRILRFGMKFAIAQHMIKSITIKIILFWVLVAFCPVPGICLAGNSTGDEDYAVALVNYIRQNPKLYAEGLGYDSSTLVQTLPWIESCLPGMNSFSSSDFLNQRAFALNNTDSVGGEPEFTHHTDYAFTGDFGGVVSFVNYMDSDQAVGIVINSQFEKELDPLYEGKRIILSSDYDLIGVSFKVGTTQVKTSIRNAYFITLCFGSSLLTSEVQIVNMINQLRAGSTQAYEYLSLDIPGPAGELSPLFLNNALSLTAKAGLTSSIDFSASALGFGYSGEGVQESSIVKVFPETEADDYSLWIFSALILEEIKSYPEKNTIFNPDYTDIGTGIYYFTNSGYIFSKLSVASGMSLKNDPSRAKIYGLVYTDTDENGCYTPGEEAPDRLMVVYDKETLEKLTSAVSNNAGQFVMELSSGNEYVIQTGTAQNLSEKEIYVTNDLFVDLVLQPEMGINQ